MTMTTESIFDKAYSKFMSAFKKPEPQPSKLKPWHGGPQADVLESNGFKLDVDDHGYPRDTWMKDYGPLQCMIRISDRTRGRYPETICMVALGAPSVYKGEYSTSEWTKGPVRKAIADFLAAGSYTTNNDLAGYLETVASFWADKGEDYSTEQMQEAVDEIFTDLKTIQGGLEKLPW